LRIHEKVSSFLLRVWLRISILLVLSSNFKCLHQWEKKDGKEFVIAFSFSFSKGFGEPRFLEFSLMIYFTSESIGFLVGE